MKSFLLIGLGRFGKSVAIKLNELNRQVMAVDKREDLVESAIGYVTKGQIGDCTNEEFLVSLGVNNYDVCIVAIGGDFQSSLEATSLLKELGAKRVVSRASSERHAKFLLRNGADEIVYPEKQLGTWTAVMNSSDHIYDYTAMDEGFAVFEVDVLDEWIGKQIQEVDVRKKHDVNIMRITRENGVNVSVKPDTVFEKGMKMYVFGHENNVMKCFKL